jgi:hypothetical protein
MFKENFHSCGATGGPTAPASSSTASARPAALADQAHEDDRVDAAATLTAQLVQGQGLDIVGNTQPNSPRILVTRVYSFFI